MESYFITPIVLWVFFIRTTTWINVTLENFKNYIKMNDVGKSRNTNCDLSIGSTREVLWLVLGAAIEFWGTWTIHIHSSHVSALQPSFSHRAFLSWGNHQATDLCPGWEE